jgi:hypothetical protein
MNYQIPALAYLANVTLNITNHSVTPTTTTGVAQPDDSGAHTQKLIGAVMLLSVGLILCAASLLPKKRCAESENSLPSSITTATGNYGAFLSDASSAQSNHTTTSTMTMLSNPM